MKVIIYHASVYIIYFSSSYVVTSHNVSERSKFVGRPTYIISILQYKNIIRAVYAYVNIRLGSKKSYIIYYYSSDL